MKHLAKRWCLFGLSALPALACVDAPPEPRAASQAPIVGGTDDPGDPAVVLVVFSDGVTDADHDGLVDQYICSATLVAPDALLTAAHCLLGPQYKYEAYFTQDYFNRGKDPVVPVVRAVANPLYNPNIFGDHDNAVLTLQRSVSIPPIPIQRTPLVAQPGELSRLVGYGVTDGTVQKGQGKRRQVTVALREVLPTTLHLGTTGGQTCFGDSGGPAFLTIGGQEVVVGVTSYGNENCTDGSYDSRVDIDAAFIDGAISGSGGGGATATPPFIAAAVTPNILTVKVGETATGYASVANGGSTDATGCTIAPALSVPAEFIYQATDPATNVGVGPLNPIVSVRAGGSQSFVFGFRPTAPFGAVAMTFAFRCANTQTAPVTQGVNTLSLTALPNDIPPPPAGLCACNHGAVQEIYCYAGNSDYTAAYVDPASRLSPGNPAAPNLVSTCSGSSPAGCAPNPNCTSSVARSFVDDQYCKGAAPPPAGFQLPYFGGRRTCD